MQVIDISSSPEPSSPSQVARRSRSSSRQPGPSRKRTRLALAREPSIAEVIELSDSDDEPPPPEPGPSRPKRAAASKSTLAFGKPNFQILADAPRTASGPPQCVAGQGQRGNGGMPLFLPGSDDEQRKIHPLPVPAPQNVHDAASVHPQPIPPAPTVPQAPPVDPIDEYLVHVLEIVPNVQPAYALQLIEQFMRPGSGNVVEFVLHALFENPSYPKVEKKGKHKREESDDPNVRGSPRPKVDYTSNERVYNCGPHYFDLSLEQLMTDFPRIPKPHIRSRLFDNRFYAPTHLLLAEELMKKPPPFRLKSTNSVVGKTRRKAKQDPEFEREREWLLLKVAEMATERDASLAATINEQEYEDSGEGIECGCCFSIYPFNQMIQCPEAHLFCNSCMTSYASNLLGELNPKIVCMDQSGCKLPFPESELGRFLSSKLLELYYRVKQRKEIEAAGLENLAECPFCEYKCVIENRMEKLFRCQNATCSEITCRACKKPDHLPKSCKEVEEDKQLDAQHVIEEAMTQALMRNCPKCQRSFIKEMGCNKMTCPSCRTVSCYICRKIIGGYEHFSNPPPYSGKVDKSKCILWDPVEQRHAEEVSEAAKRAFTELRKTRPDVNESNLKVDLPVARAPLRPGAAPGRPGDAGVPAYLGGDVAGMAALAERMGLGMAGGVGMGVGVGVGGVNMDMDRGVGPPNVLPGNPFMFGADEAHRFAVPAFGAPPRPAMPPPPAQVRDPPIAVPPALLTLARGRQVLAQPVVVAGGGRKRRKGR